MLRLVGFSGKPNLCPCSALVFQHIVMLLLLICSHKGESQGVRPSETVVALIGDDVILPCHLEPAEDAVSKSVEWGRPDLEPRFIHVWHIGQNLFDNQNPSYKGRTSVSTEKLKHGDLSLTLTAVRHSDNGIYRCYFPSQDEEFNVELVAGSFSQPLITRISKDTSGVVLQCEAKGWYPEPEVLWRDEKGKVLSAGPKETTKGPDDLLTVRSRLTVKESNDEIFTCQVHQKKINQTRETQIQISADLFETSSSVTGVSITVVVLLGVFAAAAFILWKWRQKQIKELKMHQDDPERSEGEPLTSDRQKMEDLEERKRTLEEELKRKEEEEKDLEQTVHKLMEQSKGVHEQTDKLRHQKEDMERSFEEIEVKFKSADKMSESDKAQGFMEMKNVALTAKKHLQRRKQEDDKLHTKTQLFQNTTGSLLDTMTERKRAAESNKKKISEQLEEIQRKLSEHREKMTPKDDQQKTDNNIL